MKKVQILIITLVAILVIAGVSFAAVYFATDTFKSNKDLFYKYALQINMEDFIDLNSYNSYLKRTETEKYKNEGELKINLIQENESINETVKYTRIC